MSFQADEGHAKENFHANHMLFCFVLSGFVFSFPHRHTLSCCGSCCLSVCLVVVFVTVIVRKVMDGFL